MPHELKKYFWMSTTDFSMIKANDNMEYYTWDNLDFYNGIKTGMSVVDDGEKRYRFYHIQGPHSPAVIDENAKPVKKVIQMEDVGYADAQYQQALGVIKILVELVTQLKQEGIYDNSTIIFTADHGWEVRPRPLFLMKLKNSLGKMKISDIQVSMIEDYATTIEAIVNEDWEAPNAIFNLPNVDRRRPFYAYDINTKDRTYTGRNKYISTAKYPEDIGNPSSWTKEVEFEVNLNDSSRAYIEEFSPKDGYVWLDWYTIDLMIDLNGNYNNLLFGLEYEDVYHGPQIVEIYVNGNKLLEYIADKNEEKQIIIPKEYINGDHLWITLKFPEATSPQDNGEAEDARILSLGMTGMYLESTD